jgi:hypothetical protein
MFFGLFRDNFGRVAKPGRITGKQVVRVTDNMEKAEIMQLLMYTLGMYNVGTVLTVWWYFSFFCIIFLHFLSMYHTCTYDDSVENST